jgi:hypothetical protein
MMQVARKLTVLSLAEGAVAAVNDRAESDSPEADFGTTANGDLWANRDDGSWPDGFRCGSTGTGAAFALTADVQLASERLTQKEGQGKKVGLLRNRLPAECLLALPERSRGSAAPSIDPLVAKISQAAAAISRSLAASRKPTT